MATYVPSASALHPPGRRRPREALDILRALVERELHTKYKRSVLGFVWSFITPIALAGIYFFVFIRVYRVPQEDFVLFLLTGLFPWHFFNVATVAATSSLVEGAPLIRKVAFPRILVPLATVAANFVNFLMALTVVLIVVVATGRPVWVMAHWLLVAMLLLLVLCFGLSCFISVWNVYFRDIQHLIGVALMFLFFATPIVYPPALVPDRFRLILYLNPLAGIMETFRAALFRVDPPDMALLASSIVVTLAVLVTGLLMFRHLAPNLAKEV